MFQTVHFTQQLNTQGCVILLGGFDGLHVGHRLLLSRAKEYGVPVGVMTIVGAKQGGSLFTFAEREQIFRMAGVDFAFELPFSEIKDLSPNTFIALIEKQFSPVAFVCGEDFRFGRGAQGDAALLKRITNVKVDVLPLLEKDGQKVSSSTVKYAFIRAVFFNGHRQRRKKGWTAVRVPYGEYHLSRRKIYPSPRCV